MLAALAEVTVLYSDLTLPSCKPKCTQSLSACRCWLPTYLLTFPLPLWVKQTIGVNLMIMAAPSLEAHQKLENPPGEIRNIWLRNLKDRHPLVNGPEADIPFPTSATPHRNDPTHQRPITPSSSGHNSHRRPSGSGALPRPSLRRPKPTIDTKVHQSLKRVQNITIRRRGNPPPALSINPFYAPSHPLSNQILLEMLSPMSPMSPHSPLSPLSSSPFPFFPLPGGNPYLRPQPSPQHSTHHITSTTTSTTSHHHHSRSQVQHAFNGPATPMG